MPKSLTRRAATSLVRIPPVPTVEEVPPALSISAASTPRTVGIERRLRVAARVAGVEPLDVREDHEQVRADEDGDGRRERVVVADADLVHRDGVVLVDHRDHPVLQQRRQRVLRVDEAAPVGEVAAGEQHLGHLEPVAAEGLLPGGHQVALADGGRGLLLGDRARAPRQLQPRRAGGDRPGGDDDRLAAARGEAGDPRGERVDPREAEVALLGDQARADLEDDPADRSDFADAGAGGRRALHAFFGLRRTGRAAASRRARRARSRRATASSRRPVP